MSKKKRAQHFEMNPAELNAIVEKTKGALDESDFAKLKAAMDTLVFVQEELKSKTVSMDRLRRMLFGAATEKTAKVVGAQKKTQGTEPQNADAEKKKGHGRNGAAAYGGATKVPVPHALLTAGANCSGCLKGKIYPLEEPKRLVRITGMAPLSATVYECERLRCNLCGEVFSASAPEGVGDEKYDETAAAMVGLLKYGAGLPFHRIEKLQQGMRIPLPASTQWELVEAGADKLRPAFEELVEQAAQGELLHNDDTTAKVLGLTKEQLQAAAEDQPMDRTGVFTSAIISKSEVRPPISLFFTGRQHAGENIADVLARRAPELKKPIQMCDALPANTSVNGDTLIANCLTHARRDFVDVCNDFPAECQHVLETFAEVYRVDADARRNKLSPEERLVAHQTQSGPLLAQFELWLKEQFDTHKVEPNSGLGHAIKYTLKHWSKLTLFLHEPGAPLDNNICERALKKVILHRKNALFFRTLNGARVGDIFMSLIHTSELCDENPFDYLVALLPHHEDVALDPSRWMPWNYRSALQNCASAAS